MTRKDATLPGVPEPERVFQVVKRFKRRQDAGPRTRVDVVVRIVLYYRSAQLWMLH